ncbi:MAG: alpha/beta hydrolase [Solirubrobacteraceae bacterium]|nr:alpha/beta hydrolase [Solirubrobacteraceae bacterium]
MAIAPTTLHISDVPAGTGSVRAVETGPPGGQPIVFLHGWPLSWRSFEPVLHEAAGAGYRAIALDLPEIGGSVTSTTDGTKRAAAVVIHEALGELRVHHPVIVGHDLGGMVAYPYLRDYPDDVAGVVLSSIVIPGLDPWEAVRANPYLWHFAFHATELPEVLVRDHLAEYFGYFYGATGWNQEAIGKQLRAEHVAAYADDRALKAGFDYYRAFPHDAAANREKNQTTTLKVPLLYLRGDHEPGELETYVEGFRAAGLTNVTTGVVEGSGHFTPEEAPDAFWAQVRDFARTVQASHGLPRALAA